MPMSMSAADWTRLQRQKGGTTYGPTVMKIGGTAPTNKDITAPVAPPNAGSTSCPKSVLIPCAVAGKPKTLRPASDWTNYIASGLADYVVTSQGSGRAGETGLNNGYTTNKVNRVCSCTSVITLPKVGVCVKCAGTRQRLALN
jgi:hypothetical protein